MRDRMRWLASGWFLSSVGILLLNDHVLKDAWPGLVTGKLSDFAGLVMIATVTSVVLGRTAGTAIAGVAFGALKTVPGVAEAVAPLLGGVTLRDPVDLVALIGLPPLWLWLGRPVEDQPVRGRRRLQLVGLVAAVLATTATSAPPGDHVSDLGYLDGTVHAKVFLESGRTQWLQSSDAGATWTQGAEPASPLPEPSYSAGTATACHERACVRVRAERNDKALIIEYASTGTNFVQEAFFDTSQASHTSYGSSTTLAVVLPDSGAIVSYGNLTFRRTGAGEWLPVDLIGPARPSGVETAVTGVFSSFPAMVLIAAAFGLASWFLMPTLVLRVVMLTLTGVSLIGVFLLGVLNSEVGRATLTAWWAGIGLATLLITRLVWQVTRPKTGPDGAPTLR